METSKLAWVLAAIWPLLAQAPGAPEGQAASEREPGLYGRLETTMGTIVVKFYEKESPITVKNFVDLAQGRKPWRDPKTGQMVRRPLYNGVTFHRVIPGFMIQGGDPTGTGMGDPGFTIPDEFHPSLKFDRPGRMAMANAGPRTGNCQFFITEVPTPHLNGAHTIFGQVVEGQEVVNKIARVPRDANDKPRTPVRITRVVIERVGAEPEPAKPAPTKKAAPVKK
jgi:cyclophilin family peptidyl-prolyl cis-trans isomerase